jgi:hypothetical protein
MGTRMQFVDDVSGEEISAEGAQVTFAWSIFPNGVWIHRDPILPAGH